MDENNNLISPNDIEITKEMRERLEQARRKTGLTQSQFAESGEVSLSYYQKWVKGNITRTKKRKFMNFCRKSSINPDWLLFGDGEIFKKAEEDQHKIQAKYTVNTDGIRKRLEQIRSSLNIKTQKQFSAGIISNSRYTEIINGKATRIETNSLEKLALFYNINPQWLITGEGKMEATNTRENNNVNGTNQSIVNEIRKRPEWEQKAIQEIIELLPTGKTKLRLLAVLLESAHDIDDNAWFEMINVARKSLKEEKG